VIEIRQWLDRVTGRVTMYRLVTLVLAVIAAVALVLSAVGQLPHDPLAILASAGVAIGSTVVTSGLIALITRTRPHAESSVITGLLLFFLFWPSLIPTDLGTLALAGALATVSKYLLAWRGRHIFNPAAVGAVLVAVFGLGAASWWVATPLLLPFCLVGGLLVLYRTRRIAMALLFVAVAGALLTVRLGLGTGFADGGILDGAVTAFGSYPIVFFAAFMLSEPLTLPPRRWQQLLLAVVVGVLFTTPFVLGPVVLSFEFALVVGNALAFLLGQRRGVRLTYLGKRQLTPTAWEFRFQPDRAVNYRPGQYLELTVPHGAADARGSRRTFSIASAPSTDGPVTVAMRLPEKTSSFKRALVELPQNARVHATSVGGDFLLPRDGSQPILLIAGGIGITPFLSQLAHDRASRHERDVVLVYSVASAEELAYVDELGETKVLLVAPTAPHPLPAEWRWIGPGPITGELLAAEVPDIRSRAAFVSGAPATVNAVRAALRRIGIRRVTTDYFSGY